MKLKFDKEGGSFGVPIGGGVLSPGRIGGAPGLRFRTQFAKGGSAGTGGEMKESKEMAKKEVAFMKKKGAPKSMIKHEMAEAKGKPFAKGGGIESKGKTKGKTIKMMRGGACG